MPLRKFQRLCFLEGELLYKPLRRLLCLSVCLLGAVSILSEFSAYRRCFVTNLKSEASLFELFLIIYNFCIQPFFGQIVLKPTQTGLFRV